MPPGRAKEMSKIFETPRAYSLGLSATPERGNDVSEEDATLDARGATRVQESFDETILGRELGPIYELNYADAVAQGILPKFAIRHFGLPLTQPVRQEYEKLAREITDLRENLPRTPVQPPRILTEADLSDGPARQMRRGRGEVSLVAAQYVAAVTRRKQLLYRVDARMEAVVALLERSWGAAPKRRPFYFTSLLTKSCGSPKKGGILSRAAQKSPILVHNG